MTPSISAPLSLIQTLLAAQRAKGQQITPDLIKDGVDRVLLAFPDIADAESRALLVRELEARFSVWIGEARTLADDTDHIAWLAGRKGEIKWRHWDRYLAFLDQTLSLTARQNLDDITSDILGRLEDPQRPGRWSRRGLIVGHVQSGKTANYIGLIAKAADAGYKLIVVLAGMHRNLRSQTQVRLDEGFLGFDSRPTQAGAGAYRPVGVGEIDPSVRPNSITTRLDDGDFKLSVANTFNIAPGGTPLLFVVKKNGSVLNNLLDWVKRSANSTDPASGRPLVIDVPLLVIDDEADQSSVDTGKLERLPDGTFDPEYDPKPINARIRTLLHCFAQNAYVGYTATPFANIYINEQAATVEEGEDLFPRSFIMNLPAASNYYGPSELFPTNDAIDDDSESIAESARRERDAVIKHIKDFLDKRKDGDTTPETGWMPPWHKKDHSPLFEGRNEVPPSLRKAFLSFLVACAARTVRGQGRDHKTMLIHVTRYTDVQKKVFGQVASLRNDVKARWRNGDSSLMEQMKSLWNADFKSASDESPENGATVHCWEVIEPHIWSVVDSLSIKEINGTSADILGYDEHREIGLNVVVIGGDKLSRGLTLSGLTVSYFLRSSRMYDTLMQMGRWFGYRPGYSDLCRLYLTAELEEWYRHIARASEELREQFDHMVAVGMTPRQYGLKVRSHPLLLITSAVKCRESTVLRISYEGDVSETVSFLSAQRANNEHVFKTLMTALGRPLTDAERSRFPFKPSSTTLWTDVDVQLVESFFRTYAGPPEAHRANGILLARYIAAQRERGALSTWTVALIRPRGGADETLGRIPVTLTERAGEQDKDDRTRYRIGRLLSPDDETLDLTQEQFDRALVASRDAFTRDPARYKRKTPPDRPFGPALRSERSPKHGLLLLYALLPPASELVDQRRIPYLGFGVSFPGDKEADGVEYRVNNVFKETDLFVDS